MEESNPSIEFHLSFFRAGDFKINRAQGVISMLLDLSSNFSTRTRKQDERQTESATQKILTMWLFHRDTLPHLLLRVGQTLLTGA
jgi:hypothetical protein